MNEGERIKLKYIGVLERNILSFLNYQNSKIINQFQLDWEKFKIEIDRIIKSDTVRGELILKDVYTKLYNDYGNWQYRQLMGNTQGYTPNSVEIIREINRIAEEQFKYINKSTVDTFKKIGKIVIDKGWSIQKATKLIHSYIPTKSKSRAKMIARTEVISQSNKISLNAAQQTGNRLLKFWIYTHDSRTRKTHKKAGIEYDKTKAIPLDQKFKVGKAELDHPADRNADHKEEIYNCRCTLGYTRKE
jgi:Phage Mu protein F like protein